MTKFKLLLFVAIVTCLAGAQADVNCTWFREELNKTVDHKFHFEEHKSWELQEEGYVAPDDIFGSSPTYDECSEISSKNAHFHTLGAQLFAKNYNLSSDDFDEYATECNVFEQYPASCQVSVTSLPKYRPIDGRGNNLEHPEWGASDTPFARITTNGYSDGIYEPRKSVSGKPLPNPQYIVTNVLKKAVTNPPQTPNIISVLAVLIILFITHDVHYQSPVQPSDSSKEFQCCTPDLQFALPKNESNPSCLPITVPRDDPFYTEGNVGCFNYIRSELAEYENEAQSGEIINRATSFLDLSLIYGNHESELTPLRTYEGGKLRMDPYGVLPCDANGNYLPSMARFTAVPLASIWPSAFSNYHNLLCDRLAVLNPQWDDETLFQEARRINIAGFQSNLVSQDTVQEAISHVPVNETYDPTKNPSTTAEFAIAYRMAHYYLPDEMLFQYDNGTVESWWQSDTVGRIDILQNNFHPAVIGALNQKVNTGPYGDQITNRIGKTTPDGYGRDLIAIDIQRGRDQGIGSYLDVRRALNLQPEVNSFDDLKYLMNPANADLLANVYDSIEDVDFYVGGMLESLLTVANPIVGPTFGGGISPQYTKFAGGDIYYYLNPSSPYPFTQPQIDAIHNVSFSAIFCHALGLNEMVPLWAFVPNNDIDPTTNQPYNGLTSCDNLPDLDLSAWQVPQ